MPVPLFEFEDQAWFPQVLRDYQTGFIAVMATALGAYGNAPQRLSGKNYKHLVDLCSGAGLPAVKATELLRADGVRLTLTDKFPNREAQLTMQGLERATYHSAPLDIETDVLPEADAYTCFNAFHHFNQTQQLALLRKISASGAELHVFEPLQPNAITFFKVLIATTLGPLIFSPFIRPFSWSRMLFTYVLPLGIFVTCWDGLVSVLRSLSAKECEQLVNAAAEESIKVRYEILSHRLAPTTYIHLS